METFRFIFRRVMALAIIVGLLGSIVYVLMQNKAKMQASVKAPAQSALPVQVRPVVRQQVTESLSLVGTIVANKDVVIVAETQGRVTAVMVDVGDNVNAGSQIVQVDDELKRANLTIAEANYEKAKKEWDRTKALSLKNLVPESQRDSTQLAFESAESQLTIARRQLRDTKITSPFAGVITARAVEVGTMVQSGTPVANVVDISTLKVKISVSEGDAFKLKVGDEVQVWTDVYPTASFPGHIQTIGAKGDESHLYPVEVQMSNSKERPLKANMFCRVVLTSLPARETLAIPREALVGSVKSPKVYVVEENTAKLREIVLQGSGEKYLAVLEGLKEGDLIVINGQNQLRNNTPVQVLEAPAPGGQP